MSLYKRVNSPYWWIRLAPIKGELKPLQISSGTANKRQAQQYHDKLKAERWEQDKLEKSPCAFGMRLRIDFCWKQATSVRMPGTGQC